MPRSVSRSFYQNCFQVISLAVLTAFINLLTIPIFAFSQETPDKSHEVLTEFSSQNDDTIHLAQSESATKISEIATTESSNNLVLITIFSNTQCDIIDKKLEAEITQVENLGLFTKQKWSTAIGYIVIDGAFPIILKEFIKKSVNKCMRNAAFVSQYKAAYNPAESGIRLRRSLAELVRNTNRLVLSENAKGNYLETGKIIRTSLIGHIIIAIPQVAIGFLVAPTFVQIGLPAPVGNMVGDYLKWGNLGVLAKELTGKTGENILIIEHPEMEFFPALINSGLMVIIYLGQSQAVTIGQLPRLAISESLAMSTTTVLLVVFINYDEKYNKYQLFDFSNDELIDYLNTFMKIQDYSIPAFVSNLCFVIGESSDILMDAIIGGENALKARGVFALFSLFISPISLANAQQSGRLIANSLATNETEEMIKYKMQRGMLTNFIVSTPYLVFILAPRLIYQGDRIHIQDGVVRILAVNSITSAMKNMAREQLVAFKTEEHRWLKTAGDVTTVTVPIIGVVLFRTGAINPTLRNRLVIQVISLLPAIFTISEALLGPP